MDHFPPVEDPALPPLEVPYLCERLPYDQKIFSGYPQRCGIDRDELKEKLSGRVAACEEEWAQIAEFLQSWLYMGLLHEFYHFMVRPWDENFFDQFARMNRSGRRIITTENLPAFASRWVEWNRAGPQDTRRLLYRSLQSCLATVATYLMLVPVGNLPEDIPPPPAFPQDLQDVLLSITILRASLLHILGQAYGNPDGLGIDTPHLLASPFVTQRLLRAKWCPRQICLLSTLLSPLDLLYAGQLRRYGTQQDHSFCAVRECLHSHVDETNYETRHTPHCGGCSMLSPDQGAIAACFTGGGFPLISLEAYRDTMGQVQQQLKVTSSKEGRPYVAFSHVWSDGLGNLRSNSLPTCQITRLAEALSSLSEQQLTSNDLIQMPRRIRLRVARWNQLYNGESQSPLFWIDTLCVPVQRQLKQKALRKLQETFSSAHQVVVLDEEIQETSWQTPIVENLMRIRMSKWMSRLWTLEEAILARNESLCFLFKDGVFALDESTKEARREVDSGHFLNRAMQLTTFEIFGRILEIKNIPGFDQITELRDLMATRSTTRKGDEALIVATILGLDTGILFDAPVGQRTERLLHMQRYWPYHMLFNNLSTRNTEPGYRWAPRSFLEKGVPSTMLGSEELPLDHHITGEQISPTLIQTEDGRLHTDGGLLIELPGFRIRATILPAGEDITRDNNIPSTYFTFFDIHSTTWYSVIYDPDTNLNQPWHAIRDISLRSQQSRFSILLPRDIPAHKHCNAVLVDVYGAENDNSVKYAGFLCNIMVICTPPLFPNPPQGAPVVPSLGIGLPASRTLCEEILSDMWEGREDLAGKMGREVEGEWVLQAVKRLRNMTFPVGKVEAEQRWCVG
ncbi:MAG: hypothetical protein M1839_003192 [Geoglossum umbratile]|nr:MAG: hypothetical protein M1839_003192 [Geoglossum umbratile]